VPPAERLLVFAAAALDPSDPDPDAPEGWHADLIVNPAAALRSLSDEVEVVVIEATPGQAAIIRDDREGLIRR